jgi:alkaline phosphatase
LRGQTADSAARPRNLILMIGDGMGVAQVSAHRLANPSTHFNRFAVSGFSVTRSADRLVTESAAAATALSTGTRTKNGRLAVDSSSTALQTVLEYAASLGKSTGIVATCAVTHATPAAFLAHNASRKNEDDIARQIAGGGVSVLIGGGRQHFLPKERGGGRLDGLDLLSAMADNGYAIMDSLRPVPERFQRIAMLLAQEALPAAGLRSATLGDLAETAITVLQRNRKGFFLMIEGSQIDWACHENDFPRMLREMAEFDSAVGRVLDFAERDGSTLVVVTADHETGGLSLQGKAVDASDMQGVWNVKDHSAAMVPVFARGPGCERFGGIHDNATVGRLLFQCLGKAGF